MQAAGVSARMRRAVGALCRGALGRMMAATWIDEARIKAEQMRRGAWVHWAGLACAWALVCVVGCGLACGPGSPEPEIDDDAPEQVEVPLRGDIPLTLPSAPRYADEGVMTPFDQRMLGALHGLPMALQYDPCLARAAGEYARYVRPTSDDETRARMPSALQTGVLHRAGCTDGWVASHFYFTNLDDNEAFLRYLRGIFTKASAEIEMGQEVHLGVGRARAKAPYRWAYVVFVAQRRAVFDPIPRQLERGDTLRVGGILLGDLERPDVLVLAPGGKVESLQVVEWEGGRFEASAPVSAISGEHWVEVLASGAMGPQVVALFPVYVDQAPPDAVHVEPAPDETTIVTAEDAERLMFKLVNDDRARFGLKPLEWSEEVAEIARAHSQDMKRHDFFAHVSPYRGALKDRFEQARFAAYTMGENISRNDSVYDAQQGLMQSLGHRVNILSPTFTHVGIGVAIGRDPYGHRTLHLTQNFAVPQRKLSGLQAREELHQRLNEHRRRHRLPSLELDADLQAIAARYARFTDAEDGGYPASRLTREIKAQLTERGYPYRAFYLQTHTVLDPSEVQLPESALDPQVRRAGIGVFPDRGKSAAVRWKTLVVLVQP